MQMNTSVAVVIPNYNDAKYLSRAVRSVMNQNVAADEVIVVDDCSTDDSMDTIQALAAEFPALRVIRHEVNQGVYGAIATGRAATVSDYVMFVAANDFLLQGLMARTKACLGQHPGVGLWSSMGWLVDEEDQLLGPIAITVPSMHDQYFSPVQCRELAHRFGNWFAGPSVVYNKKLMESVGAFNPDYRGLADLVCALMVAARAGAVFSPEPLAVVRMHAGSYLSSTFAQAQSLMEILGKLSRNAPAVAPELFDAPFIERSIRRFVFAAINKSRAQMLTDFAPILPAGPAGRLRWIQARIPKKLARVRMALAFVALRSFDIWVSLWNRMVLCRMISRRHADNYGAASSIIRN